MRNFRLNEAYHNPFALKTSNNTKGIVIYDVNTQFARNTAQIHR